MWDSRNLSLKRFHEVEKINYNVMHDINNNKKGHMRIEDIWAGHILAYE